MVSGPSANLLEAEYRSKGGVRVSLRLDDAIFISWASSISLQSVSVSAYTSRHAGAIRKVFKALL